MTIVTLSAARVALIDPEDLERVSAYNWSFDGKYAFRNVWKGAGSPVGKVYLHRFVIDAPAGVLVDHVNRDRLDNRRMNLRLATVRLNGANSSERGGSSRFRGVYRPTGRKKWQAYISRSGKRVYLGVFEREEDAARAYDEAAVLEYADFARLNFPGPRP